MAVAHNINEKDLGRSGESMPLLARGGFFGEKSMTDE